MINMIVLLMFIHFLADFFCQSHWMAVNKSKSFKALGLHGLTYTAILGNMGFFLGSEGLWFILLNGVLHTTTDFFTSKWSARLWKEERVHDFFVVIGFDQFIHTATLLLTYNWLMPA